MYEQDIGTTEDHHRRHKGECSSHTHSIQMKSQSRILNFSVKNFLEMYFWILAADYWGIEPWITEDQKQIQG